MGDRTEFENSEREREAVFHAELHVLALSIERRAANDALITAFVVPDDAMARFEIWQSSNGPAITYGLAFPHSLNAGRVDALVSSLVVRASAVDGLDRVSGRPGMPMVLSHEIGHIMLDGAHPGASNGIHHDSPVNLMVDGLQDTLDDESPAGGKRLTQLQRLDVISRAYRNVNPGRPAGPTPLILETPDLPSSSPEPALP